MLSHTSPRTRHLRSASFSSNRSFKDKPKQKPRVTRVKVPSAQGEVPLSSPESRAAEEVGPTKSADSEESAITLPDALNLIEHKRREQLDSRSDCAVTFTIKDKDFKELRAQIRSRFGGVRQVTALMPNEEHEIVRIALTKTIAKAVETTFRTSFQLPEGVEPLETRGSKRVKLEDGGKEPDECFYPFNRESRVGPSVTVEVGVSETARKLKDDAKRWLLGKKYTLLTVFTLDISLDNEVGTLDAWKWDGEESSEPTARWSVEFSAKHEKEDFEKKAREMKLWLHDFVLLDEVLKDINELDLYDTPLEREMSPVALTKDLPITFDPEDLHQFSKHIWERILAIKGEKEREKKKKENPSVGTKRPREESEEETKLRRETAAKKVARTFAMSKNGPLV
ncbi:hypothetical protein V5O48_004191 [Marasmius crinis-equi]|uniref:Uncharacterized protein n=1 Tax=Marasmius crinis-equi TaxID=585013 RepID=A0ABR3FR38_9AGAR